ncbi:MAG: heavy metal translocating P-type ATPase [Synergistaceae bacterium]|nr:heavy metal translocating P-type ATPase [Synergistaceae bacterium]
MHEHKCHCHEHSHEENRHRHIKNHAEDCACKACARAANIFDELEEEVEEQNREFRREIIFLLAAGVLFASAMIVENFMPQYEGSALLNGVYLALFALCGWPVIKLALKSLAHGGFFNEYTLMASAACAAIFTGEMSESVGVMIFYRLGEALQERAASKSRRSVKSLLAQKPMEARLVEGDEVRIVEPSDIKKGDLVRVLPGEIIPVDGVVSGGISQLDCSAITGESLPAAVSKGSEVSGGTLAIDGVLTIEAAGPFETSTVSRMLEMVQNAVEKKAPTERFITRFAKWYTPAMFFIAAAVFCVLALTGYPLTEALHRALVILVISCPCALVISVPLGYFGGIGSASARGILVKGASVFDNLRKVTTAVFDKTGTLTCGRFKVAKYFPADGVSEQELLKTAVLAEKGSVHPVAQSICREMPEITLPVDAEITELPGKGMLYKNGKDCIVAGNSLLMADYGVISPAMPNDGTVVHVLKNNVYLGCIAVADEIRQDSYAAVRELEKLGLHTYMLTGDREEVARVVCDKLEMSGYRAELQPEDKVEALRSICGGDLCRSIFVGDGVNDGPVLVTSDTGIAMGGFGSQLAVEVSDVVIVDDSPLKVAELLKIAKKTRTIVWENVCLAFGIKALFLVMGVCGEAGLWEAVFADVGVALLAILNATRAARS